METFFTSDTHFGDQRILELSRRPFQNTREMNTKMISNWNSIVDSDDIVYHLGDFGDLDVIHQLNGKIILLPGNYDSDADVQRLSSHCSIIQPNTKIEILETQFILIHEPTEAKVTNSFFLFGHIHKLQMVKENGLNVGVDCHNFKPLAVRDIFFYRNAILNEYDENVFIRKLGKNSLGEAE
jgi:calcineurin-like phosphoesterase family protein